ncbi:MAG TPA: M1 family metallopeptidase [Gemmatimonadales bacterium]|nr:M1 family metallopeptidase [Gemmatimonadales bacterium]
MRAPSAVLLLATVCSPSLVAQSNAEQVANDAYTRSHDYHLVHQRIEVRNFAWDSTSFDGRVTTTLVALRPALDSVVLDAGALLAVGRVADGAGRPLVAHAHGDTLVVYPARPVAFHDTLRFAIDYHARVENGRGLTFIQSEGREHRPQQIWSQGEEHDNHLWFPTYDFPNDKMRWELVATVPREDAVISNGRLVADRPAAGGQHTVTWRQDQPSATYLVSLVVAPLAKLSDRWHGVPVEYYVYHADSGVARRLFGVTPDMIDVYSRLTGVPYPWARYAQTTVADFFGGMENVSATTLVDWLPDDRAYRDRPWYQWILIPHELAHQWFGDYVTTENWANMWLNEGFAEFMPGQYWGERLGRHAADDYYLDEYRQYLEIDARRRMPLAALGSNNIYPKGALVLRMLRAYLGPERFWAALHTYLTRHALGNATSDDLRQAVLDATGENLAGFWNEWVYGAGHPAFVVSAAYDTTARTLALTVKQTQTDSLRADSAGLRYHTALIFHVPLTIRVGTSRGDVVRPVALNVREQTITVPDLPGPPSMVVFDDGNRILKDLTFDEPTSWLATQLERDPDLWNREWVIEELAKRPADSSARAALVQAATAADYYLTRAEAAEALGRFGPAAAAPLARALGDTSAAVRRAAVAALGRLGGPRAAALARATFRGDSSYEVRAAALSALVAADSSARDSAIGWGLATPSYQDAIAEAAYRIIAQTGDTGAIPRVEGLLGTGRFPAHVLAALAARGSGHALDALARHLDDERPYVRRWAVEAFRFTLPRPLALARLQALADKLRYPDTKRAVGKALEQLAKPEGTGTAEP